MNISIENKLAPVCVFSYKRLDSLKECIENLKLCRYSEETELFIFNDGPKNPKDETIIEEVRTYLKKVKGFKTIELYFSPTNRGLANSIISGVTSVIEKYGKVIVLEDDLIVTPNFLTFMNQTLDFYKENADVFSISGFSLPLKAPENFKYDVYFLPRACSWGWATWKEKWQQVDWTISDYNTFSRNKKSIADFNNGGSDLSGMLKKQMEGKIDSWAIRWCYNQFKMHSYTAYPVISKVNNMGFNSEATNTYVYNRHKTNLDLEGGDTFNLPVTIVPDQKYLKQFQDFYSLSSRFIGKLKTILMRK